MIRERLADAPHFAVHLIIAGYLAAAGIALVDAVTAGLLPGWVGQWAFLFPAVVAGPAIWLDRAHWREGLCVRCVERATNIDGPAWAARWDRSLAWTHWVRSDMRHLLTALGCLLAVVTAVNVLASIPWGSAVACTGAALHFVIVNRHTVVTPWCPRCRRPGHGDDPVDAPTPDPAVSR